VNATLHFHGVAATLPGRTTVPVRVPADLLAEAERIADQLGVDRAVVLGDLVASALPAALAEAADDLVGAPARARLAGLLPLDAATPLPSGKGATSISTGCTVAAILPGDDLDNEDAPGGDAA
jgi:hypothetical protein